MFSLVAQEPAVLWYDGCYRRIQRIELVKTNLVPSSDCRLIMLYKVVKKLWAEFLLAAFGTFLLLPQELQEVQIKGPQLNLAHPKGSEIPFHRILMAVGGCCTGGEVSLGNIYLRNI